MMVLQMLFTIFLVLAVVCALFDTPPYQKAAMVFAMLALGCLGLIAHGFPAI